MVIDEIRGRLHDDFDDFHYDNLRSALFKTMSHKHGAVFELTTCEECRLVFVRSFRPSRKRQEGAIAYLVRYHKADESELLKALKNK